MRTFILVVFVTWAATAVHAEEAFSNADLLRNFDTVAFGNEYTGRRYDVVRKWSAPVRIGIDGKGHPEYLETFIEDVARDLSETTGHPIELYYSFGKQRRKELGPNFDSKKVNVFVLYLDDQATRAAVKKYFGGKDTELEALLAEATCMANFKTKKNEIKWAMIIFPSRHPESYHRACAVEEITQILGLPNDSSSVKNSIFNDKSQYFELTEHDRWLLRALYQKDITPGMHRHDALRKALAFWKKARP